MEMKYYRKNKDKINEKRRANYGHKEKLQAKLRQLRYRERHKKQKKPLKRYGLNYYEWKTQYPNEYREMIEHLNKKRKEKYKNKKIINSSYEQVSRNS